MTLPQDVIDQIKNAKSLAQYEVTNGRNFVGQILKTN